MTKAARRRELRERRAAAEQELADIRAGLDAAWSAFNHTADPELLEASILEISALRSKYSRTLRALKAVAADAAAERTRPHRSLGTVSVEP